MLRPMVSTPDFIQLTVEKPGDFPFFTALRVPGHVGLVAQTDDQKGPLLHKCSSSSL